MTTIESVTITVKGEKITKCFSSEGSKMGEIIERMWKDENTIWVIYDADFFNFFSEDIISVIEIMLHYEKTGLSGLCIYSHPSLLEYHKERVKDEFWYEFNKLTDLSEYK